MKTTFPFFTVKIVFRKCGTGPKTFKIEVKFFRVGRRPFSGSNVNVIVICGLRAAGASRTSKHFLN